MIATSESENERVGKRKVKSYKYENYITYVGPPRLASSSKESQKSDIEG